MSDDPSKPVLLVKKADAKKGSLWHTFANKRIIKQHGGFDIPEGDLHAVQKYHSPLQGPTESLEENNATLSDIEKEIKKLKDSEYPVQSRSNTSFEENEKRYNED